MLSREIFDINDFIKQHNHINYCEAVIYPDGKIQYAVPSHSETLIRIYMEKFNFKTREEAYDSVSVEEYSIEWMVNKTECVAVWFEFQISPNNISVKQKESLDILKQNGCIR